MSSVQIDMPLAQHCPAPDHVDPSVQEMHDAMDDTMYFEYDPDWREKSAQTQTGKIAGSTN